MKSVDSGSDIICHSFSFLRSCLATLIFTTFPNAIPASSQFTLFNQMKRISFGHYISSWKNTWRFDSCCSIIQCSYTTFNFHLPSGLCSWRTWFVLFSSYLVLFQLNSVHQFSSNLLVFCLAFTFNFFFNWYHRNCIYFFQKLWMLWGRIDKTWTRIHVQTRIWIRSPWHGSWK